MKLSREERAKNRKIWTTRVEHQEESGLSVVEYCRKEGLSRHQFFYHRKQLREKPKCSSSEKQLIPVVVKGKEKAKNSGGIRIESPNGFSIKVESGFDREMLKQVLHVMENPC